MPKQVCIGAGCRRIGAWGRGSRCPQCKAALPQPERRSYSGTALERQVRAAALAEHGAVCSLYCHRPINLELTWPHPDSLVLAHVHSHADGGTFDVANVRPAHKVCNERAGR